MGTNVVRLTDRNYMGMLRERIDQEHRKQLQKRISDRELKEIERERLLIIEGKSNVIPEELASDPIFVVNKTAAAEISKVRSKLKTQRERNADKLKLQGARWEVQRLIHEERERLRYENVRERQKTQYALQDAYKEEDATCGMDLLRIHKIDNDEWRSCEQNLKDFLDYERFKMKERSNKKPKPFHSDPLDIENIVRARKKFRETESRIRHELEEKFKYDSDYSAMKDFMAKSVASRFSKIMASEGSDGRLQAQSLSKSYVNLNDHRARQRSRSSEESTESFSSVTEHAERASTISESTEKHRRMLEAEIAADTHKGYIVSEEQYEHLRYNDQKLKELSSAKNVLQMYKLAEEIIIGEMIEDDMFGEEEIIEEEEEEDQAAPGGRKPEIKEHD